MRKKNIGFDIDGTITEEDYPDGYNEWDDSEWNEYFYSLEPKQKSIDTLFDLFKEKKHNIFFVTARLFTNINITHDWFMKYGLYYFNYRSV